SEICGVLHEHLFAPGSVRITYRLFLTWQEEVEVLGRTVRLPENRHHLEDIDVHLLRIGKRQARLCFAPHLLELKPLRLEKRIHEVEHVKPDAATVDLGEDIADFVDSEVTIKLDVRNLILLGNCPEMLPESLGIYGIVGRYLCTR